MASNRRWCCHRGYSRDRDIENNSLTDLVKTAVNDVSFNTAGVHHELGTTHCGRPVKHLRNHAYGPSNWNIGGRKPSQRNVAGHAESFGVHLCQLAALTWHLASAADDAERMPREGQLLTTAENDLLRGGFVTGPATRSISRSLFRNGRSLRRCFTVTGCVMLSIDLFWQGCNTSNSLRQRKLPNKSCCDGCSLI